MQFDRFKNLIGENNFNCLSNKTILIVGLGGVGSYVLEALVRSGIKHLILVDFDKIDITNLNRQLMTNLGNLNEFKTDVLKDRCKKINKDINITIINEFIDEKNIDMLFKYDIDYFIDCCDSINTKKMIIEKCIAKNIKLITCMGMGNKLDFSKIEIMDLRKTSYDPIAKILRKYLKDQHINKKIMCCISKELPVKTNTKTIYSSSYIPGIAGLTIAGYVITDIINENKKNRN